MTEDQIMEALRQVAYIRIWSLDSEEAYRVRKALNESWLSLSGLYQYRPVLRPDLRAVLQQLNEVQIF